MSFNLFLDLGVDPEKLEQGLIPNEELIQSWLKNICQDFSLDNYDLSIRVVSQEEGLELNQQYRNKAYATNILSFPCDLDPELTPEITILGDLIVCLDVVAQEAQQQNKKLMDHWAHLLIHGTLHLLGYDHLDDQEAEEMESLEIEYLEKLAIANPYQMD